jgi:hypothetical protein
VWDPEPASNGFAGRAAPARVGCTGASDAGHVGPAISHARLLLGHVPRNTGKFPLPFS